MRGLVGGESGGLRSFSAVGSSQIAWKNHLAIFGLLTDPFLVAQQTVTKSSDDLVIISTLLIAKLFIFRNI